MGHMETQRSSRITLYFFKQRYFNSLGPCYTWEVDATGSREGIHATHKQLLKGRVNTKTPPEIHPWKLLKHLFPPFGPDLKYPFQSPPRAKIPSSPYRQLALYRAPLFQSTRIRAPFGRANASSWCKTWQRNKIENKNGKWLPYRHWFLYHMGLY